MKINLDPLLRGPSPQRSAIVAAWWSRMAKRYPARSRERSVADTCIAELLMLLAIAAEPAGAERPGGGGQAEATG